MKRYKNLSFAYSFEIITGFTITLLIIIWGPYTIALLSIFALRPFLLEVQNISPGDNYWYISYQLFKYTSIIIALCIIGIYFIDLFLLTENFLIENKERIIIVIPLFLLIHGILGLFSVKRT